MKTPFYQILELYEDAVLSHAQHDLTCTETAVLKLGAILNQFAETRDDVARESLVRDALDVHGWMVGAVSLYRQEKVSQAFAENTKELELWDHNQRMADIREEYKQ